MKNREKIEITITVFLLVIIAWLALVHFTSCNQIIDIAVNDIDITMVNETSETAQVLFFSTEYPLQQIANIIHDNELPVMASMIIEPDSYNIINIVEPIRLCVWYGVYINDTLYVTGKADKEFIKIQ
jgi:hypothetical protein